MVNWLKSLYQSFYSAGFYMRVAQEWQGVGLRFLMFLALIISAIVFLIGWGDIRAFVEELPDFAQQLPEIHYHDRKLSTAHPGPFYLHFKFYPEIVVIDTQYPDTGIDTLANWMGENHVWMVITSTKAISRDKRTQKLEVTDLTSSVEDYTFTQEDWQRYFSIIQGWASVVLLLCTFLGLWIILIASTFIWGLLGKLIAKILGVSLKGSALVRLASVSSAPVWAIGSTAALFGLHSVLISYGLRISYMVFAVHANRRTLPSPVST